jgi:hypothetical protein
MFCDSKKYFKVKAGIFQSRVSSARVPVRLLLAHTLSFVSL